MNSSIVFVIPTYNEAENLPILLSEIKKLALPSWSAIIVDDASPDGTGQLADQLAAQYPLKVLHRQGKNGLGSAYRDGFAAALQTSADLIVQMDADLSHRVEDLPAMLAAAEDYDLVIGSRYIAGGQTQNWSVFRKFISQSANFFVRQLLRTRLHDLTSGYKIFRRSALQKIQFQKTSSVGYNFQIEVNILAQRAGLKIKEVPITFEERTTGKSKFDFKIILESASQILSLAFRDFFAGKHRYILLAILALAALLRFFDLSRGNAISDEVLYGFRSIGYLDFDFALNQPSILQLFNHSIPSWTSLSFHDHPLLVFLIQHIFLAIGGDNLTALRLPSALFGLGSVYLVYLLGRRLFSSKVGMLAGLLMSVNVLMLYASRTAVQESQTIFFILLAVYFFIRSRQNARWLLALGASIGLGLLTKYTTAFIILPLLVYALFYWRQIFKSKYFYFSIIVALAIFSPSIIYNIYLYREFGHFDFQLSYIFGQQVTYWQVTPGKEIGSISDGFLGIFQNLWHYSSWALSGIFGLILAYILIFKLKKRLWISQNNTLLGLIIIFNFILYLGIGPAPRFLAMIIPWLCLGLGIFFARYKKLVVIFILFIAWEIFFSINSYIVYRPAGVETYSYSRIHWDQHDWGFNDTDAYLDKIYAGKYPEIIVPYNLAFLEEVREKNLEKNKVGQQPARIIVVYDDNIFYMGSLWTFDRKALYQSWPIVNSTIFATLRQNFIAEQADNLDLIDVYFVTPTQYFLYNDAGRLTTSGQELKIEPENRQIQPEMILNKAGDSGFFVYKFSL